MNQPRQLLKRLLGLYPIRLIKSHFNQTGNAPDVLDSVSGGESQDSIRNFARLNFYNTKQHIHLRRLDRRFRRQSLNLEELPYQVVHENESNNRTSFFLFARVRYEVVLGGDSFDTDHLDFYQPIMVQAEGSTLTYHITILEKNINHYYGERPVLKAEKQTSEEEIVNSLDAVFNANFGADLLDLNRGVKYLWQHDWIDSKYVRWNKDVSTATETMHEDFTVKDQYPDYYEDIIQAPLQKTVFVYLRDDSYFPDHFTIEPGNGIINIPVFPKNDGQINNVITEILRHN